MFLPKALFFLAIVFCLSPYGSPPAALALGLVLAFTVGNPFPQSKGVTKLLLQASVVLLGFGMDLHAVAKAGREGLWFTIATIFGTLALGYVVGRVLGVAGKTSSLVSAGTAICGGSAIAAVAPVIDADSEEISVSLGTVFILNSVGLVLFPLIGRALDLTQNEFGVLAAIAIHDTSSVVGAAQSYGAEALTTATTIKLVRALWIAPVAFLFMFIYRRKDGDAKRSIAVPWFIFLFVAASAIRSYAPAWIIPSIFDSLVNLAKAGMTVTLFLIGLSLSPETLRKVGLRPLLQGVILWAIISFAALVAVINTL